MGDWVYTVRWWEHKMEIRCKEFHYEEHHRFRELGVSSGHPGHT
jgi:hypothetical protein